jgi:hypothetical protein
VLSAFELGDEADLAARADRAQIGGLVDGAADRDGGLFLEVVAEAGLELIHRLDDAAQVPRLDREFAHPAGVPPAEPGGKDDSCGHRLSPPEGPFAESDAHKSPSLRGAHRATRQSRPDRYVVDEIASLRSQ